MMEYEGAELPGEAAELHDVEQVHRRSVCVRCGRPASVCLCDYLPSSKLATKTRVIVLQHPHELRQRLATVPLLQRCLESCHVVQGRRFKRGSCPILDFLFESARNPEKTPAQIKSLLYSSENLDIKCASCKSFCKVGKPECGGDLQYIFGDVELEPTGNSSCTRHGLEVQQDSEIRIALSKYVANDYRRPCLLLFPCAQAVNVADWVKQQRLKQKESKKIAGSCCSCSSLESLEGSTEAGGQSNSKACQSVDRAASNKIFDSYRREKGGKACLENPECRNENEVCDEKSYVLICMDGTWQHAQEMLTASQAFLLQFTQLVCLPFDMSLDGPSMGEEGLIVRKEPFSGFVSTMEAVARTLRELEENGEEIERALFRALGRMVELQQECLKTKLENTHLLQGESVSKA